MKTSTFEEKRGIKWTARMQLDSLDFADDLIILSHMQQQMQEKTTNVAAASTALCTQNTADLLARHYQQQPTVGEKEPHPAGGRNEEEVLEVDKTHIKKSTQLLHKASPRFPLLQASF
ncbi:unnamed protein product [Schistosoma margrebowiei]|uniref:Uncharacterized protein n=1 Tax=Schistosoma margrebowiei TaxID=48269 RepID=A0A183MGG4_9TREM|nr:unnamed protein product [Schistosoma margrebowiei]